MISREEAKGILSNIAQNAANILAVMPKSAEEKVRALMNDIEALDMAIGDMQKQIPKKPKEYEDKYYGCPVCGNNLMHKWLIYPEKLMLRSDGLPYCLGCGQAIDWSDNE